ncbi:IS110 family RNA-guided transposase, partial [Streptomonospora wellingtoniae]
GGGRFASRTRTFSTVTAGLLELAAWLEAEQVQAVAMEATATYWKPVYYLLEGSFDARLVNPRDVRQVKGRKTDVKDAQWLAQLLQHDLVRSSFVPEAPVRDLRELTRGRAHLKADRTRAVNRLEKQVEETGLKITAVTSAVLGASTRAMLEALVAGERDPAVLADLAKGSLRAKRSELERALRVARFSEASAFMIGQSLSAIDMIDAQTRAYEERIAAAMRPFGRARELLVTIPGVSEHISAVILGAIGADVSAFPTAAHLASWAGVCPGNNRSAGREGSAATTHGDSYLRGALGMAAGHIARSSSPPCYLKSYYARVRKRRGARRAQVALQHKIIVAVWHMLAAGVAYAELGADYFDRRPRPARQRADHAKRLLEELSQEGYDVTRLLPSPAA